MKYKLVACDLDGTLLDTNGCLSEENSKAIEELASRGIIFVPTTGRAFYEIPESIRTHPSVRYFISSDGAVIEDLKTGERFEFLISGEKVKKTYDIMKECNLLFLNHKHGYCFTDAEYMNEATMDEYNISQHFRNQLKTYAKYVENYEKNFASDEPCEMLCGCFKTSGDAKKLTDKLKEIEGIHCTSSFNGNIEIVDSNAGKRNAVNFLIKKLGLTSDEIITVGDSTNDLEMIRLTPNSIAMANANAELKAAAGRIGCSNNDHIARCILDEFIENI